MRSVREWVLTDHGVAAWDDICDAAEVDSVMRFPPQRDFQDEMEARILEVSTQVLGLSRTDAARAFGRHWACVYALRVYPFAYEAIHDVVAFLETVNEIHRRVMADTTATPTFLELRWLTPTQLAIGYRSRRNLIGLLKGLIEGYAFYFGEDVEVTVTSAYRVELTFASPSPSYRSEAPRGQS